MRSMLVSTMFLFVGCAGTSSHGPLDTGDAGSDAMASDSGPPPDAGPPADAGPDEKPPEEPPYVESCQVWTQAEPIFEPLHAVFDDPFELTLVTRPGVWVRYTLDGSTPTPTHGEVYRGPIPITTTTVVRAMAFNADGACSVSRTHSYIHPESVLKQSAVPPPGWPDKFAPDDPEGPYPADYEMDPEVVNHPNYAGGLAAQALRAIPTISLVTDLENLWDPDTGIYWNAIQKTALWERPVSVEWIDPGGGPGFSVNAGIRMHGQASRKPPRTPKKTLRLYFRTQYGPGKLSFPVFEDESAVVKFDRLLLRNGGNRSWPYWDRDQRREADYVNDAWARQTQLEMGGLNTHSRHVHLYLNGLYWGLYVLSERPDEKFVSAYLGGLETDFEVIKSDEDIGNAPSADIGTVDAYLEVQSLVESALITDDVYAQVAQRVDLEDLVDFSILTHYLGKTDWPNHNWIAYRKVVGDDTRFKFIAWDNDSGLNKVTENVTLREFPDSPVVIFNRLLSNPTFRALVRTRLLQHIGPGGALSPERCAQRYAELAQKIDLAVIAESARWGDYSRDVYIWQFADPPKGGPAYLYSRDLPHDYTDPHNLVDDEFQMTWVQVRDEKLQTYCPRRATVLVEQYLANHWIDPL